MKVLSIKEIKLTDNLVPGVFALLALRASTVE